MLAVIPARGGSKGLPRKNILPLAGKPLIQYTIEAALKSAVITRVIVSTDCSEIAKVAKDAGAEIPFIRPGHLAEDSSLAIDNYKHLLEWIDENEGLKLSEFCVLQPTSPLRSSYDIDEAISLYSKKKADSVISYCYEHHPIHWHRFLEDDGRLINEQEALPELKNRQDYKASVYPNGAIYVFDSRLIHLGVYESDKTFAYVMPRERSVDIDTIEDFQYAEYLIHRSENI
ncbi:acylneuraminate cytidylyltransferase family protein [Sansalvadorimonas sp. 2012CJ34-2]|uniref:Acylneuraminate cytidylyltransferase family protein n=1 Tax=Parendozoicomonas callyspongiae TaxID=2942213 RepID=A0ABT0PM31_9GAMM|nr:acylneuraminate cytidylyltransferase family protein [Sansalvadorimonas sp. 2012CJ34-2]MCL6272036.1 acylneuraminate cytidylyltransferase family protein [Sansalvadorimonas sp. 2012CJ34-2]